jgi:dTDP-4-dehydrorhamnose reductase
MKSTVLVIGGSGFIGGRLVQAACEEGHTVAWTYNQHYSELPGEALHTDFAAGDTEALDSYLTDNQPDTIVYCSSPSARADSLLHRQVSIYGMQHIVQKLRSGHSQSRYLYLSTNAVFGGKGSRRETDQPDPAERRDDLREYACTRADAEQWLLREWAHSLVVRTATVGGRQANGAWSRRLGAAIEELRSKKVVRRFDDRFISPTLVDDLVAALLEMMELSFRYRGILHVAGSDARMTDYTYTSLLSEWIGCTETSVEPEHMSDVPAMNGSPCDTTLDSTFTRQLLRTRLRNTEEQFQFLVTNSRKMPCSVLLQLSLLFFSSSFSVLFCVEPGLPMTDGRKFSTNTVCISGFPP